MSPSDLREPILLSVLGGGLLAAFLHAALPTHWLPFVLVGRAQRWGLTRTLSVAAVAGLAHIGATALVGGLIVVAGMALDRWVEGLLPHLSATLLILLGAFYLARATLRQPVVAAGPSLEPVGPAVSNRAAALGLVALMAVSPGEVLLPVYLTYSAEGPALFALLTLVFAVGTIAGMLLLTALAHAGWSILRLERWARYEGAILGFALIGLGLLVLNHRH